MGNSREPSSPNVDCSVERIATGDLRATDLVESCLAVIDRRESDIRAWQYVAAEEARGTAARLDGSSVRGALHGVPVGIKDVIDTADMPTGYGSKIYEGFRPMADAPSVALLRAAGAIVLGKTVTTEFASIAPAATTNPHNPRHTPGGSSSGSAAAVAANMVPAALGTQTAGSIVRPAAYCGVVGYKPTFGLVECSGVKTLARSFDTVGTFTRSVRDAALLVSVMASRPILAAIDPHVQPRIGVYFPPWSSSADPAALAVLRHAAAVLRQAGLTVVDVDRIEGFERLLGAQQAVMDWDMVHGLFFELETASDRIDRVTRDALLQRKARLSPDATDEAHALLRALRQRLHEHLDDLDVLLVPSAPGEAPIGLESTGSSEFNRGWTALHAPCINIPAGVGPRGLPLGVQVISRLGGDAQALNAGAVIERYLQINPYR